MADLVLGLARSAVEGTLSLAKTAIDEEKKMKKSVQHNLMLITDEFEMMHSFLNVAKERVADEMTKTLVRQVRGMALDVEDCIQCVIYLDPKLNWWWRHFLPSCMAAATPASELEDAVSNIELLKARIESMSQRNTRYSHIGDISFKPAEQIHQPAVTNATALDMLMWARNYKEMIPQLGLTELINQEQEGGVLQVISVMETGGDLGTTSIVKKAYEDPATCEKFTFRAWVKLTHPFNSHEFIRSLLIQFYTNKCQQQGATVDVLKLMELTEATGGRLSNVLKKACDQRYLIVVEDVFNMADWDTIRTYLPDRNNSGCIVVNTRQLEIACLCIGHSFGVSELKRFTDDHSICVFFKKDWENIEDIVSAKEIGIARFSNFQYEGREMDIGLVALFASATPVPVVSVWGISGVGKSHTVAIAYYAALLDVYSDPELKDKFKFETYGWVNVRYPFNLRDLSQSLLLDMHSESIQRGTKLRIKDPIQECRDLLHEQKCLVVIDGLQSTEEWDLIKDSFALGNIESHVIVITNEESVATYCATRKDAVVNIKGLEVDTAALDLFKKKVSEKKGVPSYQMSSEVTDQAKLILHKCGGLPKLIVAVAEFVAVSQDVEDLEWWRMLSRSFMQELETNPDFGSLQDLFAWVRSYFRSCPYYLKPCIFYLSIFPVALRVRRRRLVRRWIAEGYCRDNQEKTAEETGDVFFDKLFRLSMIHTQELMNFMVLEQVASSWCEVNGFFREYIISRPMEENLIFALEGNCRVNFQRSGRHLVIDRSWVRDENVFKSIDFSKLRSLTVFGEWKTFFVSDKMLLLRVLDLEDASGVTDGDLVKMVNKLPRLKFLSLRGCRQVTCLPDFGDGLRQLQTLDIRDTSIITLPKSIIKLHELEYIRAGTTPPTPFGDNTSQQDPPPPPVPAASPALATTSFMSTPWLSNKFRGRHHIDGIKVHGEIGELTSLHTLGVINIMSGARRVAILKALKKLTQLHKLGVSSINQDNSKEIFAAISGHGHLKSLSVQLVDNSNQDCLDGISSCPKSLNSLKLYGQIRQVLPVWIKDLKNLTKLKLQMPMLSQEAINFVKELSKLRILRLCFKEFQDGELQFVPRFNCLQLVEIACTSRLQSVKFHPDACPVLEMLRIRCYGVSSLQFSGLEHLGSMGGVLLSGSYDATFRENLTGELAKHPRKPFLKHEPHSS